MKNIFKAIGWVLLEFFTTIVSLVIILLILLLVGKTPKVDIQPMDKLLCVVTVSDIIIVLIALLVCKIKNLNPVLEWKLFKLPLISYFMPCVIAFTYSAFYLLISHNPTHNSVSLITILSLLIISPISDEIINRGIILNTLKKSFSPTKAIIISSIISCLLSLPTQNLLSAVNNVILCVIMAIIYEKTGSLQVTVVAHSCALIPEIFRFILPEIPNKLKIIVAPFILVISVTSLIIWIKPKKA